MQLYANKFLNHVDDLGEFRNWNKNPILIGQTEDVKLMDTKYNTNMICGNISGPLVDIEMDENKNKFQILLLNVCRTAMLDTFQVLIPNNARGGNFNKCMVMNGTPKLGDGERIVLYMNKLRYATNELFAAADML